MRRYVNACSSATIYQLAGEETKDGPGGQPLPGSYFCLEVLSLYKRLFAFLLELVLVLSLTLAALIPRILLALRLDMVTDEVVYILGGKIYLPLLEHLSIRASGWDYNYEHPPLVKLLIGVSLSLNASFGHPFHELFAARLPSIIAGTLLVVAIYWLGRAPFGRIISFLAALCLAVSPWLVYFSALAYLDMTMTLLITIAYLLLWHAIRSPWLYLLSAFLVGLAVDSKYTAALAIPGMILFTAYYFFAVRWYIPPAQRPRIPWLAWLASILLAPLTFLAADPAIWPDPIHLLNHSFDFEWHHSIHGHLTFLAGHYSLHVPQWAILYIIIAKISAFVTIPAAFFILFALIQLVRFHLPGSKIPAARATSISFLLIWLLAIVGMFSLLNIVVGTHYHLPAAPPVALAGAFGLAVILRYGLLFTSFRARAKTTGTSQTEQSLPVHQKRLNPVAGIILIPLAVLLVGPHLVGLATVYAAEGYTSEFFHGENNVLQVAYPGYREAVQWLASHTKSKTTIKIGLIATTGTLTGGADGVGWFSYNSDFPKRFKLVEAHPDDASFPYNYLVWPMHLIQRGYTIPEPWRSHIVHVIMGGNTVYCYILTRSPNSISP
jgi:4-amino-4-deoxy-L-arabinose transferase-like glycosyltransferase